ncbi:regulator of chromosome condensation 1/beta-lactamase-inhibitor protein II [Polychytrium aggregatum]|uniref:regulator of chromosome condensation 1/beta-lactamase-inhibitor protein II n=1 Tax=Polychytrium aggregatum TaxID=110093 RepID=UPI0022FE4110|nr:regulator of chromosome condensation 1/beta-lactamase-inhibitor protein II [Polychytrium aggregatum]KAI9204675.1 regulator of chromosome condensation 1/beta-lactamase-inhibitor protein II [Polychytrium aggregatum]
MNSALLNHPAVRLSGRIARRRSPVSLASRCFSAETDKAASHRPDPAAVRKPVIGETPNPKNYTSPHPFFPKYSTRDRLLSFAIGAAAVGLTCFYAIRNDEEAEQPSAALLESSTVSMDQWHSIAESRQYPGVYVWGNNNFGIVAPESDQAVLKVPAALKAFEGKVLRHLAVTEKHAAAIDEYGNLLQWGDGYHGQDLSRGNRSDPGALSETDLAPEITLKGKNLVQVACSSNVVYALSKSGQVYAVSARRQAQKDSASSQASPSLWSWLGGQQQSCTPVNLPNGISDKVVTIAAGENHLVAISSRGQAFVLPTNQYGNSKGQLGLNHTFLPSNFAPSGTNASPFRPDSCTVFSKVESLAGIEFVQAACGAEHTLLRSRDGRVFGFGSNSSGQLGTGPLQDKVEKPIQIETIWNRGPRTSAKPLDAECTQVAAAGQSSVFVVDRAESSEVMVCGIGQLGQLGNGNLNHVSLYPVLVRALSDLKEYSEKDQCVKPIRVIQIACGGDHNAAVLGTASDTSDIGRDVLMWGANNWNQLRRIDGKQGHAPTPMWIKPIHYGKLHEVAVDKDAEPLGRLQLAPLGSVKVDGKRNVRNVRQEIVCGPGYTMVYYRVI